MFVSVHALEREWLAPFRVADVVYVHRGTKKRIEKLTMLWYEHYRSLGLCIEKYRPCPVKIRGGGETLDRHH